MIPSAGNALAKFRKSLGNANNAKAAFSKFDSDGDAEITFDELRKGMGSNFNDNEMVCVCPG
jgi:Ca2+-binding EF-hand superfamily protein